MNNSIHEIKYVIFTYTNKEYNQNDLEIKKQFFVIYNKQNLCKLPKNGFIVNHSIKQNLCNMQ